MSSKGTVSHRFRSPARMLVMLGLTVTPLFYLIFRSAYSAPELTLTEIVFLIGYSLLCSANYIFAYSNSSLIEDRLPRWLNSYWSRIPIYVVTILALTGLLHLLMLPRFYDSVIGKSLLFLVFPYMIRFRRTGKTSISNRISIVSYSSRSGEDMTFSPKRSKALFLLLGSSAFVLGGIFIIPKEHAMAWICICFFGLGIPIGILLMLPGCRSLVLTAQGFTMVHFWRRLPFKWTEVSDIAVVDSPQGPRVGWNVVENLTEDSPRWRKRIAQRKYVNEMCARNALLLDDYGVSADELCRLMTELKNKV